MKEVAPIAGHKVMGERSQVNANVGDGNTDISTPLLLGEIGHGLAPYLAHGCFNQIFPFGCC